MNEIQTKLKSSLLEILEKETFSDLSIRYLDSLVSALNSVYWLRRDELKTEADGNK